ncbi:FadR/GntR family transcriptional regulator [Salirhabdus sp. Marseille-P4669]|uniref:FadR/GntR family transcriptional regulator n=1 Tax=Salirhabdus sp. Marseille-P4669 TaxID=2042310 RepID=UPI000C7E165D|nr:FadR/GntR family transcriptional regulator [Salirhabdus sp. Marseille-P4669]
MEAFQKPQKIYEKVADELVNKIKNGEFQPGDRLQSVEQLAKNFNVGRSAIREALSALRAKGILEMRQGEGTFVKAFDPKILSSTITTSTILMNKKDIQDLLEIRKILELGSVASAVKQATRENLQEIEEALEDMKQAKGNEELGDKADLRFHMGIAKASNNNILIELMDQVSGMMGKAMRETRRIWLFSKGTTLERIYMEHKEIYEAIVNKDEQLAQSLMLAHLTAVEETLMKNAPTK